MIKIYDPEFSCFRLSWGHSIVFTWGGETYRAIQYFEGQPRGINLIKARRRLVEAMNDRRFKRQLPHNRGGD